MKEREVPQHEARAFVGHKKALYATDERGKYRVVPSSGWDAEQIVLDQAIDEFDREAAAALTQARQGTASSLAYHMWRRRMDVPTLSQCSGFFQWQVRRHLRPGPFARLSASKIQRYAEALGCTAGELQALPDAP
jgi:hypothetical protein